MAPRLWEARDGGNGTNRGRRDRMPAGVRAGSLQAGRRRPASGRGLGPDGDDAAAGVAALELAWGLRRAAVDLDPLHVLRRGEPREVGARLVPVEVILRVAARRRANHL